MIKYLVKKTKFEHYLLLRLKQEITLDRLQLQFDKSKELGTTSCEYFSDSEVIVSLTSFDKRLYDVYLVIESLMHQSYKANKIILWLNEPLNKNSIPETLIRLMDRGLIIKFVPDHGPYDKLIHSLEQYPKDRIITVDDDILYPFDFIERLVKAAQSVPDAIHYYRGHRIVFDMKMNCKPYNKWVFEGATYNSHFSNFPTNGAGTIFPPNSLHPDVTNRSVFQHICPSGDDIWYWLMALRAETKSFRIPLERVYSEKMPTISYSQNFGLYQENVLENKNDIQINNLLNYYKINFPEL